MNARAEEHVVMLPLGNRTGTVKMISPTTGRLVSRDQFRVLPMPASVIAAMNEFAHKDGRTVRPAGLGTYPNANNLAPEHRSDLPDYIAITPHNGDQPDVEPHHPGAIAPMGGAILADEAGLAHHPLNQPQEYDVGGGGVASPGHPPSDLSAQSDPLNELQEDEQDLEQPQRGENRGEIRGEIRGDLVMGGDAESGSNEYSENDVAID
jgi:hypothetical protein